MEKDPRIVGIRALIRSGDIKYITEIVEVHLFPLTVMAHIIHTNSNRMRNLLSDPGKLQFKHIYAMAQYFEVPPMSMFTLVFNSMARLKEGKERAKLN